MEEHSVVTERDGGGGLVLVTWWRLAFTCREPWWRAQDGDRKRKEVLGRLALVACRRGRREDLVSDRTTLHRVPSFGSLHLLSLLTAFMFLHLYSCLYVVKVESASS